MRILFYTDSHFKYRASMSQDNPNILIGDRLNSLVNSYKWMYDIADREGIDLIVNGGDVLDKPSISSEESLALQMAFSQGDYTNIPEVILVGNHDRKSTNLHALDVLQLNPRITVVDKPCVYNDVGLLPFTLDFDSVNLDELSNTKTKVLFSHVDMIGTNFGGVVSTSGFDPTILDNKFSQVYNGHIHTAGSYNERVTNAGSFVGTGLGDDYTRLPGITIISITTSTDNPTLSITNDFISNPYAILYRTVHAETVGDVISAVNDYSNLPNNYYLRIISNDSAKKDIKDYMDSVGYGNDIASGFSYAHQILNYSLTTKLVSRKKVVSEGVGASSSINNSTIPSDVLKEYIDSVEDKKLPTERPTINKFVSKEFTLGGTSHE